MANKKVGAIEMLLSMLPASHPFRSEWEGSRRKDVLRELLEQMEAAIASSDGSMQFRHWQQFIPAAKTAVSFIIEPDDDVMG